MITCKLKYILLSLLLFGITTAFSQQVISDVDSLPKVFKIGEHENLYGELYEEYHEILLTVCNDDMNIAFDRWMHMIVEMEEYSKSIAFDINGVKVWLKVFWNATGKIDHLSFYLKPESRNIDPSELEAFFSSFMNYYEMPVTSRVNFTHNGSAQFPTAIYPPTTRK